MHFAVLCFRTTEKNEAASKYWSFSLAVEHGFIDTEYPHDACIHPPTTDWAEPLITDSDNSADLAAVAEAPRAEQTGGGEGSAATGMDFSAVSELGLLAFTLLARRSAVCRVHRYLGCSL